MDVDLLVEITVPSEEAELAADDLWQAGATAVELREGEVREGEVREEGGGGGGPCPGRTTTVSASFPTPAAARQVAGELSERGAVLVEAHPGWRDAWRQFAQPLEVGAGLLVAPGWRDVAVGGDRLVLRIDPGPCFGSGSHPSTRLILAALDRDPPRPGTRVLDVGCGSGILSVAAARLGAARPGTARTGTAGPGTARTGAAGPGTARRGAAQRGVAQRGAAAVTAVDIDPAAVEVTAANAAANGVADWITASTTPIEWLDGRFDLALVNVTARVHAELGPEVIRRVEPGGRILLAGLLPGQWRHVAGAYLGAAVAARTELDGWEGLELTVGGGQP